MSIERETTISGHTPGPWFADEADMFGDHNIVLQDREALEDHRAVAAVVSNLRAEDEVAANASLIAAAPELLEGLQHAVSIIELHVDRDALGAGGDPRDGQWPLLDEYLHHMRAAITKATGGGNG